MKQAPVRSLVLGFLHVQENAPDRYRAGYLLTNDYGRPIEFHYTSEVPVSRSFRMLHGPRFEEVLFAEILAKPMTDRQSSPPQLIAVDALALVELRRQIPAPVVRLTPGDDGSAIVTPHGEFGKDAGSFERIRTMVPPGFDWLEPFARIKEALAEIKDSPTLLLAG